MSQSFFVNAGALKLPIIQISSAIGDWKRKRISNGLRIELDFLKRKVEEISELLLGADSN